MPTRISRAKKSHSAVAPYESTLVSISSSLAAMFMENNLAKGLQLEIPSLDIVIDDSRPKGPEEKMHSPKK